jgi:hypothetical protein
MKKRIEKLFNEAGFHKPEVERLGVEHKFEKFAELIIRECAAMTRNLSPHGELAEKAVKEHFGVE